MHALKAFKHFNNLKIYAFKIQSRNIKTVEKFDDYLGKIRNIGVIAHIDAGLLIILKKFNFLKFTFIIIKIERLQLQSVCSFILGLSSH